MVVIGIAAILAALAAPDFSTLIKRYRVRQTVEDMTATLYAARSEAIKRGGLVKIQKVACPEEPTKQIWNCGWIVFYDADNNGALNSGDEVLQRSAKPAGVSVARSQDEDTVVVDRWGNLGTGIGASGFTFQPAEGQPLDLTFTLCISGGGRIRADSGEVRC